ncbi:MAG: hypothetical protein KDA33_01310 [Phycisphaerales bacterium]|nr:hypothetical protein [Phycisphaerales bacterium]
MDDATAQARFGADVAVSGDYAIFGAPYDSSAVSSGGAAYIFERSGSEWRPSARLTPSEPTANQQFGARVAIDGDTAVIGARLGVPDFSYRYAIYVFRHVNGEWLEIARLSNSLGVNDEFTDLSVAIDGNQIAVGCPRAANQNGAVFVFEESAGFWVPTAIPTPSNALGISLFGASVAWADNQLLIGAPRADNGAGVRTGAVYRYSRDYGGGYLSPSRILPEDGVANTWFGASLATDNLTLVVGACNTLYSTYGYGAAYIFERTGSGWRPLQKESASDGPPRFGFGRRVDVWNDTIAVASNSVSGTSNGAIVVYRKADDWRYVSDFTPTDGQWQDEFGYSVALAGDSVLAGAPRRNTTSIDGGSVYSFDLVPLEFDCNTNGVPDVCDIQLGDSVDCNGNGVPDACELAAQTSRDCNGNGQPDECEPDGQNEIGVIPSPDAGAAYFGWTLAMCGTTAVIGVSSNPARVHVYENFAAEWIPQTSLSPDDGDTGNGFGSVIAMDGDTVVVGAHYDDEAGEDSGAAYVFHRTDGEWSQVAKLMASDAMGDELFGRSVAVSGSMIVVGTSGYVNAAYVYRNVAGVWQEIAKLTSPTAETTGFGYRVAIDGDTIAVTAPRYSTTPGGAMHVFREIDGQWTPQDSLGASDAVAGDIFGQSVDLSQGTIVIGAQYHGEGPPEITGRAYVFREVDGHWAETAILRPDESTSSDYFGNSVAVRNGVVLVSDVHEFISGAGARHGPVHVFREFEGEWRRVLKLRTADGNLETRFGGSVATDGAIVLTGAAYENLHTPEQTSAVYVHDIRDLSFVGDLNDDGAIDFDDAELFTGVLLGVDADPLHVARADTNCSGAVDGRDLQFFIESLIGD